MLLLSVFVLFCGGVAAKMVGIRNGGSYCYISSSLQAIVNNERLRHEILSRRSNGPVHLVLGSLFGRLLMSDSAQDMDVDFFPVVQKTAGEYFIPGRNDDPDAFLLWIFENHLPWLSETLEATIKQELYHAGRKLITNVDGQQEWVPSPQCKGRKFTESTIRSKRLEAHVHHHPGRYVHEIALKQVQKPPTEDVDNNVQPEPNAIDDNAVQYRIQFHEYQGASFMEDDAKVDVVERFKECSMEDGGTYEFTKHEIITKLPPVLYISATKFEYSPEAVPTWRSDIETLYLPSFEHDGARYHLHSIIVFISGQIKKDAPLTDLRRGHYVAYVNTDIEKREWKLFNDSTVSDIPCVSENVNLPNLQEGEPYSFFYVREDELQTWNRPEIRRIRDFKDLPKPTKILANIFYSMIYGAKVLETTLKIALPHMDVSEDKQFVIKVPDQIEHSDFGPDHYDPEIVEEQA